VTALVPAVALVLVAAALPADNTVTAPPIVVTAVNRAAPFTGALTLRIRPGDPTGVVVEDSRYDEPGWTLIGHAIATGPVPADLGWTPALAPGSDAEGTVTATGAAAGNGLGSTRVRGTLRLPGAGTLTLTLTSL
jgi:hypothetical protein